MSSTAVPVSQGSLKRFTLFTSLPTEIRFMIWRLSLSPRIVEVIQARYDDPGFFSRVKLPGALKACRDSRRAVDALYPLCFGSFLQPERVRFNFELDTLYMDIVQEEVMREGLPRLIGVLKETELARLKYLAVDLNYLRVDNFYFKRTIKLMKNLREFSIVDEIMDESVIRLEEQIKFYAEHKQGEAERGWPATAKALPDVEKEYDDWKPSESAKFTAVYGWRPGRSI